MDRSSVAPGNSDIPGWKIERSYRPGVLLGNWIEDSKNFKRGHFLHDTIYRTEYQPPIVAAGIVGAGPEVERGGLVCDSCVKKDEIRGPYGRALDARRKQPPLNYFTVTPGELVRRRGENAQAGMPADYLFYHHGDRYLNNYVTLYDEQYNGRWREKNLPGLRKYDIHSTTWRPEKSDTNVQDPPTNFGLLPHLQDRWADEMAELRVDDYRTTYSTSYTPYHPWPKHQRYANHKLESTTLHPVNKTLKDLHLRNTPIMKVPEQMPAEMTYVSV